MPGTWQLCFGDGHQQRYPASRPAVLRYTLGIGPKAASTRFEVYAESGAVTLAGGQPGGRTFALAEVIDLSWGETERLQAGLFHPANEGKESVRNGLPSRPESPTFETGSGNLPRRTP